MVIFPRLLPLDEFYFRRLENCIIVIGKATWIFMIFNHLNWNFSYLISHFGNFFQILNQFKYRHLHFEHISYPGIIKLVNRSTVTVLVVRVRGGIIFDPVQNMEEVRHVMYMHVVSPLIHFQIVRTGSKAKSRTVLSHMIINFEYTEVTWNAPKSIWKMILSCDGIWILFWNK